MAEALAHPCQAEQTIVLAEADSKQAILPVMAKPSGSCSQPLKAAFMRKLPPATTLYAPGRAAALSRHAAAGAGTIFIAVRRGCAN
jgi:hypothetical protein